MCRAGLAQLCFPAAGARRSHCPKWACDDADGVFAEFPCDKLMTNNNNDVGGLECVSIKRNCGGEIEQTGSVGRGIE